MLKSQPIYGIGIDFEKYSTKPCIICWVIKPLDDSVLECDGNANGNGGDDDGDSNDKVDNSRNNRIYVNSTINAESIDSRISQDFNITANFWVEITREPHEMTVRNLKFDIEVNDCGVGNMLSNNCQSLKNQGVGYLLHSIKVHVSSIPENEFVVVGESQPKQHYPVIENLNVLETGFIISIFNFMSSIKKAHTVKSTLSKWNVKKVRDRKGECWSHQHNDNYPDEDNTNRGGHSPGFHSGHWHMKERMSGFCINISQELHFQYKIFRKFRTLPNTKPKLLPCPKMAHNLEISFNDLTNFNEKLANIKKHYYENDEIKIKVGNNEEEKIEESFQNLDGKIERSKSVLK
ncbi:13763_t:CDS:2 [Funneliformis caledonium]|uniref:13763_t:CDS:1 n=1 Tax=Funneliformis caledonium TaxID=1117310 RepID=A0A9N8V7B4_9GLOM|nr:13763_t:CDS:2 [Funneliformis caledonium]